jgi:Uma2 family endonuclease
MHPHRRFYWQGALDLVMEILSPSTALYDKRAKFRLYEKYDVREYWIADAQARYIEVGRRVEENFILYGVFGAGETFTAAVLGDKTVEVSALFGAA